VKLVEWGLLPADAIAPLYWREEARWRAALAWDTTTSWTTVESARVTWGLPGFVCCDGSNTIRGWTFYLSHDDTIEVGGIFADTPEATDALVERLLGGATSTTGFIYATAPGLHCALTARGISVERFSYLARATNRVPSVRAAAHFRTWRLHDVGATATLLQRAYGSAGRLFARDNSLAQWRVYVENLIAYPGCGLLRPDLSRVVEANGELAALALVTALASDTAHLAQLAVSPAARRAGLARALVGEALRSAHASGFAQMSLLVADGNAPACRLYCNWGFAERGEFLAWRSDTPQ
jgi:ribosomal protein S18 acetylase RimI-like enzyme